MKRWSILLMVAAVALLMPSLSCAPGPRHHARLSIDKSADSTSVGLGDTISYSLTVANTGKVTVRNVTVTDYRLWTTPQNIGRLRPHDNITISGTYTVVAADFPGPVINTAKVTGSAPNGKSVSATASASVDLNDYTRAILVTKTATPDPANLGDTISYTYTVENTGQVTTDNLTLIDDKLGDISLDKITLNPGETASSLGSHTHTVVAADFPGPVTNTATATGTDSHGNSLSAVASASVELNPYTGSLEVTKTADPTSASLGDTITYTFRIANTDNVTADNVTLEDSKLWSTPWSVGSLKSGESVTRSHNYTVVVTDFPGPIINTANVTATDQDGNSLSAVASASVDLNDHARAIVVTKTATPNPANLGDIITYTYAVENTGHVVTDNLTLIDDKLGDITLDKTTLDPGETASSLGSYTHDVVVADFPGPITNMATATGTNPNGSSISATASASVDLISCPEEPGSRGLGFYKNHPCVVEQVLPITIAGEEVTTAERAIEIIKGRGSHSSRLRSQLMVTLLNMAVFGIGDCTLKNLGLDGSQTVNDVMADGEALLADPSASKDKLSSMQDVLDSINNSNTEVPLPEEIAEACPPGEGRDRDDDHDDDRGRGHHDDDDDDDIDTMSKADILKRRGVPGKGIDKAPGLQKPFNPKSQAAEHVGKKNQADDEEATPDDGHGKSKMNEQLKTRTRVENQAGDDQATREQLKTRTRVENQADNDEATDDKGKGKPKDKKK